MAITVLERPQGQVLSTTSATAIASSVYGTGDAIFGGAAHGLVDGDYIYATSDIEDYNGFWYVDQISANTFKLKQYPTSDYVQYIQDATITYYASEYTHGWSAVHLPITYRLETDLFPHPNTRTITGFSDDTGLTRVSTSGSFVTPTTKIFDYIELTDGDYIGVYQILELYSATDFTINLAYDSASTISGDTIRRYLNNFTINVGIYAGVSSGHEWGYLKPYELAASLELVPDENGQVFFSVNEILKSYIRTVNNPLLGTMPNYLNFWAQFYIKVSESYDLSDGYSLGTYITTEVSDESNFQGYVVNSKLEFKNISSGYMSEYLIGIDLYGRFLTSTSPVLFSDIYQDISFIKTDDYDYSIVLQYYINGNPGASETIPVIGDPGLYRVQVSHDCSYDRVDISIYATVTLDPIETQTGSLILTGFEPLVTVGPP